MKHSDAQYHFVRDIVEDMKFLLVKVDTLKNVADSVMNFVSTGNFSYCRETMGIVSMNC